MNLKHILSSVILAAVPALYSLSAEAAVPATDRVGTAAFSGCPTVIPAPATGRIYHFDKIIFVITGPLVATLAADQPALDAKPRNTPLDIKVVDRPTTVADLKGKVLTFLGATTSVANRNGIRIDSVEYASVVCPASPQ
jgi:hypothetical protein